MGLGADPGPESPFIGDIYMGHLRYSTFHSKKSTDKQKLTIFWQRPHLIIDMKFQFVYMIADFNGVGVVKMDSAPGSEYVFRERALGAGAISEIFDLADFNHVRQHVVMISHCFFSFRIYAISSLAGVNHLSHLLTYKIITIMGKITSNPRRNP